MADESKMDEVIIIEETSEDGGDERYEPKWEDVDVDEEGEGGGSQLYIKQENISIDDEDAGNQNDFENQSQEEDEKGHKGEKDEHEIKKEKKKKEEQEEQEEKEEQDEQEEQEQEEQEGPVAEDFNMEEVLKTKVKLNDGTEELMFSRGPQYTDNIWPINCHLCSIGNLTGAYQLESHINGVLHKTKLSEDRPDAATYRKPLIQTYTINYKNNNPIKISPGEQIKQITPEYYDRLQPVMEYTFIPKPSKEDLEILEKEPLHEYNLKAPILGLCYAFKYRIYGSIEYFCGLCKTKGSGEAYQHFVGGNHQIEYVRKHFPLLYNKVVDGLHSVKSPYVKKKFIRSIFRKIYKKFEELRGFRKINFVNGRDFKKNIKKYMQRLRKCIHYNEKMLEIPENELEKMIKKCLNGESIIEPDPISLAHPDEGARDDGRKDRKRDLSAKRRDSPPPRRRPRDDKRLDDTPQNWDRYRRMLGAALDDLDEVYEEYERVPEKHPDYEREWRRFWRRRTRELERDNIDPNRYDFKPEWLNYFADLLKDLHSKAVAKRKFETKRSLRLSYNKRSPSPIRRRKLRTRSRSRSRPRYRRRSPTPDSSYRDRSRRYSRPREYPERSRQEEINDDILIKESREPLSVISVLRLLTALEDQLGSMGPKALGLLSRAILFQKENNLPADDLLMDKEYYIFFVTCKEKLKGQLIANIVSNTKINAVNKVINDMESLLELCDQYVKQSTGRNPFTESDTIHCGSFIGNEQPRRNIFDSDIGFKIRFGSNDDGRDKFKRNVDGPRNQFIDENSQGQFSRSHQYGGNNGPRGCFSGNDSSHQFDSDIPRNHFIKNDSSRNQLRGNEGLHDRFDLNEVSRSMFNDNQFDNDDTRRNLYKSNEADRNLFTGGPSGGVGKNQPSNQYFNTNESGMWSSGSGRNYRDNNNYNLSFNNDPAMGNYSTTSRSGNIGVGGGNIGMLNKPNIRGNDGFEIRNSDNIPSLLRNTFRGGMNRNFN